MQPEEIIRSVKDIYTHNAFMQHCGIKVHSISCGKAAVGLRIDPAIHTNLNGKLHGGLLTTLVDMPPASPAPLWASAWLRYR